MNEQEDDDEKDDDSEYEFGWHTIKIVSGASLATENQVLAGIKNIEEMIGTGYYDGEGDELMKQIVSYLRVKSK